MRKTIFAVVLGVLPVSALAQPAQPAAEQARRGPDLAAQKAAMLKLGWLVGSWEGRGWVDTPAGRMAFRQTETVEARLDGLILTIEGRGYSGTPETLMFNAFAALSHDDRTGKYGFRSWTRGYSTDAVAELRADGAFVWTMTPPGQVIRYTIAQPQLGAWREVGERSTDNGATFTQFFEMELTRK